MIINQPRQGKFVRFAPCHMRRTHTDFNVLKQHRTGYASAICAADWTLERLGSIPIWLLVGENSLS